MENQYYILSLKHTDKTDKVIYLWRPNNQGYCDNLSDAGVYTEIKKGYHDSEGQLPITFEQASKITLNNGKIPNCQSVWDELGLKWVKRNLVRK